MSTVTKNFKEMLKGADVSRLIRDFRQVYINKYYDLFCSKYEIKGFSRGYLKTFRAKLWEKGSVWVRKDKFTGEPICCDYAGSQWDWNNEPTMVQLVTRNNAPESIIPHEPQVTGKDGVIVYLRPNEKGYFADVAYYIGKLGEAEALITVNLALQRAPWILTSDSSNYAKLKAILRAIFNDEPTVITDIDRNELDAIELNTPWLVDKLTEYEERLENKIKTLLGLDNQGGYINRQQQNLDTTNSNNEEINASNDIVFKTIKEGLDMANEVLGLNLSIKDNHERTEQISKSKDSGGHKEEEEDGER